MEQDCFSWGLSRMDLRTLLRIKAVTGGGGSHGKNLFDEANAPIYNRYLDMGSNHTANWAGSDTGRSYSMAVKPNTDYAVTAFNTSISILRVAAISEDPATATGTVQSINAWNFSTARTGTIKTGADEKWLVIQLNGTYVTERSGKVQVEYGTEKTEPYEPYK